MDRDTREALNQPFEFDEVLLPKGNGFKNQISAAKEIFGDSMQDASGVEYKLRKLSVRLRTINNACEASFKLSDGRPVTEVSLYGSRDRQYIVGPYWAIQRLMQGLLPQSRSPVATFLIEEQKSIETVVGYSSAFIEKPEKNNTIAILNEAREVWVTRHTGQAYDLLWGGEVAKIKSAHQIELTQEKIEDIRAFVANQKDLLDEFSQMLKLVRNADWWWVWTSECKDFLQKIIELRKKYREERDQLRSPDWNAERKLTRSFSNIRTRLVVSKDLSQWDAPFCD